MTALCGGGLSAPKSGVAETIIFTTSALASLLNNRGGLWATLAAPLLGVLAYSATNLCGTDPPAQPTITAAEYKALLELQPWADLQSALEKLRDLVAIAIWHDMCECASVATPAPPAGLWTPPADVTLPTYTGSCPQPRLRTSTGLSAGGTVPWNARLSIVDRLWPGVPTVTMNASTNNEALPAILIDPAWVNWALHVDYVGGTPAVGDTYGVTAFVYDATRTLIGQEFAVHADPGLLHDDDPNSGLKTAHPTTAVYVAFLAHHVNALSDPGLIDVSIDITCSGIQSPPACCPPDPAVLALLQQLIGLATVQQRWSLPFATLEGSSHGATGTNAFSIERVRGLRIHVSTIPAGLRVSPGNPEYLFDLGWISVTDGGGMLQELRVTRTLQEWFPAQMQLATDVGYALRPGVIATITELLVEP